MKYIDKVLSKKGILSEEEYEQELVNKINELEKEYNRLLKLDFAVEELYNKKTFKRQVKKIKPKIKDIRQKLRVLQKELDEYGYEGSIYNNISNFVIELDYLFKSNAYNSFYKLKTEKDPKKKLKLYRKVFVSLIEDYNELDMKDYKHKRITNNIINLMRCKIYKEKAKVKKLIQIESIEDKKIKPVLKEEKTEEIRNYVDITDAHILKNEDIKEVMLSFKNIVRNSSITVDFVNYVSIIRKRLIDEDALDENFELINRVIDSIKYRKLELKKRDKYEKNILRLCINELKELSDIILLRRTPIKETHDYKFDIVFELLKDKKHYQLIKKMIHDCPSIVNVRNNKRSILSYILQLYINNYMMILEEHRYNYNIDYLKEVYKLFLSSSSLYLTDEDKIELDSILDEYIYKISELDINSKKKNYVINEVKGLYVDNLNKDNNYIKNIDKYRFDADIKELEFLDPNHSKRPTEIDLTHEHTFSLENPYICYSLTSEKGILVLKIHTVDLSNIAFEGSEIEKYIYNCMMDNKKINSTLSNYLEFKEGETVSALTYEIRDITNKSKNKKELRIYKSRIKVDGEILDYASDPYVYKDLNNVIHNYINENGNVNLKGLNKIEYILNDILKKEYLKTARNNNLPIITKKERKVPAIDPESLSNIQVTLEKLGRNKDSKKISNILEESITDKWYDSVTRYNDIGDLNITGNPNYLYLMNQRMIKLIHLNERQLTQERFATIKEKTIEEYSDIINKLNEITGHKTEEDFDYKKRRNFKSFVLKKEE